MRKVKWLKSAFKLKSQAPHAEQIKDVAIDEMDYQSGQIGLNEQTVNTARATSGTPPKSRR